MIKNFYNQQVLLITGASGNVGRVFLEKVLFSLDSITSAYIVIRKGKYATAYDRLHDEIL